jgi:hypothetical protein
VCRNEQRREFLRPTTSSLVCSTPPPHCLMRGEEGERGRCSHMRGLHSRLAPPPCQRPPPERMLFPMAQMTASPPTPFSDRKMSWASRRCRHRSTGT